MTRHLIHVGYAKAGSTYLQAWFARHTQLRYIEGGLGGFRDAYQLTRHAVAPLPEPRWAVTSYEGFSAPLPTAGAIGSDYGEHGAPIAARQEQACHLLGGLFPGAHILIVTRGFRAMILSSFSQYARSGGQADFENLLREARTDHPWRYDDIASLYRAHFGDDHVILLPYELLERDPERFLGELARRLDIAPEPPLAERLNPKISGVEMRWYPRLTRTIERLPVPGRVRARLHRSYVKRAFENRLKLPIRLLQRLSPQPPVDASAIPPDLLEQFRGLSTGLADEPLFAPFAEDYLF